MGPDALEGILAGALGDRLRIGMDPEQRRLASPRIVALARLAHLGHGAALARISAVGFRRGLRATGLDWWRHQGRRWRRVRIMIRRRGRETRTGYRCVWRRVGVIGVVYGIGIR